MALQGLVCGESVMARALGYNRKNKIPGVSGRRIPGSARMPTHKVGGFLTNVPHISPGAGGSAYWREYHRQQIRDSGGRFAGGWGYAWTGLSAADRNVYEWANQKTENIQSAVEELAREMKEYMQSNAPWSDRTAAERIASDDPPGRSAREELQASVVWHTEHDFTIYLGHGADIYYGIWLEVRWGGKYAIVVPTAEHYGPQIMARIGTRT